MIFGEVLALYGMKCTVEHKWWQQTLFLAMSGDFDLLVDLWPKRTKDQQPGLWVLHYTTLEVSAGLKRPAETSSSVV